MVALDDVRGGAGPGTAERKGAEAEFALAGGASGNFRLAWLWVEGWRQRLRKSGDIVEQTRWEWRLDDVCRRPNQVPLIAVKLPAVPALKGPDSHSERGRRKSVRFE